MKKLFVGIGLVLLLSMVAFAQQERQDDDKLPKTVSTDKFMKVKLKYSANIIEGLALEDFKKIGDSAEALLQMSQEADWNTIKSDAYLKMSEEFRASARRLQKTVGDRNLDGATLAYFEVTLNCVRCHKYVRGNR